MQGLHSAHGVLQRAVARELRLKHTPTLEFVYDDTSERGMRIAELIDERGGRGVSRATASRPRAQLVLDALRDGERFVLTTHEHPDGDALGSLAAMQHVLCALGKDAVSFLSADEFPLPYEYRFLELPAARHAVPDDLEDRTVVFLDCGNIDRNPAEALKHGRADPQHRPPPRQHALRHRRPRRAGRVVHRRGDLGPDARPRRRAHAADGRGAVRRPGHRHRQVHVREHRRRART